jgi:hypothetical protein
MERGLFIDLRIKRKRWNKGEVIHTPSPSVLPSFEGKKWGGG